MGLEPTNDLGSIARVDDQKKIVLAAWAFQAANQHVVENSAFFVAYQRVANLSGLHVDHSAGQKMIEQLIGTRARRIGVAPYAKYRKRLQRFESRCVLQQFQHIGSAFRSWRTQPYERRGLDASMQRGSGELRTHLDHVALSTSSGPGNSKGRVTDLSLDVTQSIMLPDGTSTLAVSVARPPALAAGLFH